MNIERIDADDAIELALLGELNIYAVGEAYGVLTRTLAEKRNLRIDLSQVSELDSAGVQILLAARRAAEHAGCRVELVAPSADVLEVIDLLDLRGVFGDRAAVSA